MRLDLRKPDQMRAVKFTPGYLKTAEGSVLIEMGNTVVLCAATVEDSVPSWMRGSGRGWVTAEYSMLPRATATRTPREITKGRASGRTMEIQRLIGRSLRAVVNLEYLGERSLIVDCDVLQADGGTRTASITGAWVALAMAVKRMLDYKTLSRNPLTDQVAAISVGVVKGQPLLDLNYEEDSSADVDMNLVMTGAGQFVEVQATGEKGSFGDEHLASLIAYGKSGVTALVAMQKQTAGI